MTPPAPVPNTSRYFIKGYSADSVRHGGIQRADQITDDILSSYRDAIDVIDIRAYTKWDLARSTFFLPRVWLWLRRYRLTFFGWFKAAVIYRTLRRYLRHRDTHTFLLEGWDDLYLLAGLLLKESGARYIPFPQNIDGLRPGLSSRCFGSLWERFGAEVSLYRGAVQNVTICDFDRAIIESFAGSAVVHPFYPSDEKLSALRAIKRARLATDSDTVLMLGSASNPPTCAAMTAFLRGMAEHEVPVKVIVAGFGTEQFTHYGGDNITVLGGVSEERLNQLLESVRAVVVPSVQTSGFLTRLVDLNLAGVPVIMVGAYYQARNLEDYGISFAARVRDLPEVLRRVAPPRDEFPRPCLKDALERAGRTTATGATQKVP